MRKLLLLLALAFVAIPQIGSACDGNKEARGGTKNNSPVTVPTGSTTTSQR